MNKVYTIGRDLSCDIVINDDTDVVSRFHASLKVKGHGKYMLVDQSRNGTYVNGIRMSPNEEIPVTRKDVISFAHVADLDWSLVPKEKSNSLMWILLALVVIVAMGIGAYFVYGPKPEPDPIPDPTHGIEILMEAANTSAATDTIRDTVFIKETPKTPPVKEKGPKSEEPVKQEPVKEDVVDAIY